jgi:hypothetical protein
MSLLCCSFLYVEYFALVPFFSFLSFILITVAMVLANVIMRHKMGPDFFNLEISMIEPGFQIGPHFSLHFLDVL